MIPQLVCEHNLSSVNELIRYGRDKLDAAGISNPKLESELLLGHLLSLNRFDLYFKEVNLTNELIDKFEEVLQLRRQRYPLQYIIGWGNFMGLDFLVNQEVLIPRPETEILVEKAIDIGLKILANGRLGKKELSILDIGTGAGNIAISLTKYLTNCKIWATDISSEALEAAKKNARYLSEEEKITFILTDLWPKLSLESQKFDLIISNPPYIARNCFSDLPPEIKFEPILALDGGDDGLDFYHKIISQSPSYLNPSGYLMLEIGHNQAQAVKKIINSMGKFAVPGVFRDLNNRERVVLTNLKS